MSSRTFAPETPKFMTVLVAFAFVLEPHFSTGVHIVSVALWVLQGIYRWNFINEGHKIEIIVSADWIRSPRRKQGQVCGWQKDWDALV